MLVALIADGAALGVLRAGVSAPAVVVAPVVGAAAIVTDTALRCGRSDVVAVTLAGALVLTLVAVLVTAALVGAALRD